MTNFNTLGIQVPYYENNNDAFIPEVWAQEGLLALENHLVLAQLCYRDYEEEVAQFGDVVNTRLPGNFVSKRKTDSDSVTNQDATSDNIAVKMNLHEHVSFIIKDGEASKSISDLVAIYAAPALIAVAQGIEENLAGEIYNFMNNSVGQLGTPVGNGTVLKARKTMIENKLLGKGPWNMAVTPDSESDLLALELYTSAEKVGDDGSALREGFLGRKHGFNMYTSQVVPSVNKLPSGAVLVGAINNASGYDVGTTTFTVDGFSGTVTTGSWITIAGDDTPLFVVATSGSPTTTITVATGLNYSVVNNAEIVVVIPAAINDPAGYALDYSKELTIDGITVAPSAGQLMSTGTTLSTRNTYGIRTGPTTTSVTINRALDAAVANNAVVGLGPAGNYNFAFQREAIALVTRPLALPDSNLVNAAVVNHNGLSMRVVITYDGSDQGHRVTMDVLCGVKTMRPDHGVVMYG